MKVLFDFSRRGIPEYSAALEEIRKCILESGHTLTNDLLQETQEFGKTLPQELFTKLRTAISMADAVIIEGSTVSISLGYVVAESINLGKPLLFLSDSHLTHHKSRFLLSIDSKLLHVNAYDKIGQLRSIVEEFLNECPSIKTRFNLVLSSKLNSYVLKRSVGLRTSKTEYVIGLIEKDIRKQEKS